MKKYTYLFLTLLLSISFSTAHAQQDYSIKFELSAASMNQQASSGTGRDILFEFGRSLNQLIDLNVGFSFSRNIYEIGSDSQEALSNPFALRRGFNVSSLDIFTGVKYSLFETSTFSLPLGAGISRRVRNETFIDQENGEVYIGDNSGLVLGEVKYQQSKDLGMYGSVSADYRAFERWSFGIQSRYQFYNEGFSIFKVGISTVHYF